MKQSYWEENWIDKLFVTPADAVQLDFFMFLLSRGNHLVYAKEIYFLHLWFHEWFVLFFRIICYTQW